MVHAGRKAKSQLNKKSRRQLIAVIMYMLTILQMSNPKAYRSAEKRLGLMGKLKGRRHRKHRKQRGRKHRGKRHRGKRGRGKGRKLSPGVHEVRIRGKTRKVRVLQNGRWRFMKS